jgi:hypothetical protein
MPVKITNKDPATLRYVILAYYKNGDMYWRYNPPAWAKKAKLLRAEVLGTDPAAAYDKAVILNARLDFHSNEDADSLHGKEIDDSSVEGLMETYKDSGYFRALAPKTQSDYSLVMEAFMDVPMRGKSARSMTVRNLPIDQVTPQIADKVYTTLLEERGQSMANYCVAVAKRAWNIAHKWGLLSTNPWTTVTLRKPPSRDVVWTETQIETFFEASKGNRVWRTVGMIFMTAYETSQRLGDTRLLTTAHYRDNGFAIVQSKTSQFVWVPISDRLRKELELLKAEQDEDTDTLVTAVHTRMRKEGYSSTKIEADVDKLVQSLNPEQLLFYHPDSGRAYTADLLSKTAARIREAAGLPAHLQIRDARRTAITEMIDRECTPHEVMSIGGHKNVASLAPYARVHGRSNSPVAVSAMSKRWSRRVKSESDNDGDV